MLRRPGDGLPDVRLARQVRLGVAFDGDLLPAGRTRPFTVSVDADLRAYDTVRGPGASSRPARSGGSRHDGLGFAAVPDSTRSARRSASAPSAPASRLVKGIMAEGPRSVGGRAERGWGVAARASF